jgi:hypothetical protein
MKKQDVRMHGDNELFQHFQNDQSLYNIWIEAAEDDNFQMVKDQAEELFIYTPEQLSELEKEFIEEVQQEQARTNPFSNLNIQDAINQETDELKKSVLADLLDIEEEDRSNYLEDVLQYGCQSGMVHKLIYYDDTCQFYNQFGEQIWELLTKQAEQLGHANAVEMIGTFNGAKDVYTNEQFKNLLAWFAYEETARQIAEKMGIEV